MIIDIHGHIVPPEHAKKYSLPPSLADIDGLIEQKARAGIDLTIVGSPVGGGTMMRIPGLDNFAQTSEQIKGFNDFLAGTVAKHPKRLRAYAYTNPFGDDKMLADAAKTVKDGGFVGLIVNTSVRGEYLDSGRADAFFAMAAELDVPIFLHPPALPVGHESLQDFRLVETIGRFCDVTVGLAVLAFSGRLEKYPNLKFIAATAGGAIGLLTSRLDLAYQPRHYMARGAGQGAPAGSPGGPPQTGTPAAGPRGPGVPAGGPRGGPPPAGPMMQPFENKISQPPSTYIKRLYVDTASLSLPSLMTNLQTVGADHMLFGTDSPPLATPFQEAIALVNQLPISDGDKQMILSGNAQRMFKLEGVAAAA